MKLFGRRHQQDHEQDRRDIKVIRAAQDEQAAKLFAIREQMGLEVPKERHEP